MSDSNFTIISGGQTGVDRAALDVAIKWGIPYRGWCPAGRWAEDGKIPERYQLEVTPESNPAQRTARNVKESDGVLILGALECSAGTQLAWKTAVKYKVPVYHGDLGGSIEFVLQWVQAMEFGVVNVVGPRESESPGIYKNAFEFLESVVRGYLAADSNTS